MGSAKSVFISKTFWINALTLLISLLTAITGADFVSEETLFYLTGLALPIVNVILRFLTSRPVSVAPAKPPQHYDY